MIRRALLRVPRGDRWLVVEAALCLGAARLAVVALPFRWVTRVLRQEVGETPTADDSGTTDERRRVAWALDRVSRRTPWDSNCLAQALAGKQMLRRRGISSTLYLGVAKEGGAQLEAHAWLRSGALTLTGGDDLDRFAVIATFADATSGRAAEERCPT
jgi:hypothetical protein